MMMTMMCVCVSGISETTGLHIPKKRRDLSVVEDSEDLSSNARRDHQAPINSTTNHTKPNRPNSLTPE